MESGGVTRLRNASVLEAINLRMEANDVRSATVHHLTALVQQFRLARLKHLLK